MDFYLTENFTERGAVLLKYRCARMCANIHNIGFTAEIRDAAYDVLGLFDTHFLHKHGWVQDTKMRVVSATSLVEQERQR